MAGYSYSTTTELLTRLSASQQSLPVPRLLAVLEAASEAVDSAAGRTFRPWDGTVYVDVESDYPARLPVPDTVQLTGVVYDVGGNTFESELAASQYVLGRYLPLAVSPFTYVLFNFGSTFLTGNRFRLTGAFGWPARLTAAGVTLTGDIDTDDSPSFSTPSAVPPGTMLLIDSERIFVRGSTNPVEVDRGVDGTTAAAHLAASATIQKYVYPPSVVEATLQAAALRLAPGRVSAGLLSSESFGDLSFSYRDPKETVDAERTLITSLIPASLRRELVLG